MFKVHAYLDDVMIINWRMEHLPRIGDTVRISDEQFGKVTEVVWCLDEDRQEGERVNVRIVSEKL